MNKCEQMSAKLKDFTWLCGQQCQGVFVALGTSLGLPG